MWYENLEIQKNEVISVDIYSQLGMFKKNDINDSMYLTYNWIPRPFLLGIVGNILGLGGYGSLFSSLNEDPEPEYYKKLKLLKIAIQPTSTVEFFNGIFKKTVIKYNNSLGYASKEEGNILNITEQILVNPSYRIYIDIYGFSEIDLNLARKLKFYLKNQLSEYIPYMGKNEFFLNWKNYKEYKIIAHKENKIQIHSLFKKNTLIKNKKRKKIDEILESETNIKSNTLNRYIVFEKIPIDFEIAKKEEKRKPQYFYHYKLEEFVFTNISFKEEPTIDYTYLLDLENNQKICIQFF